jgi:hypothetical protein
MQKVILPLLQDRKLHCLRLEKQNRFNKKVLHQGSRTPLTEEPRRNAVLSVVRQVLRHALDGGVRDGPLLSLSHVYSISRYSGYPGQGKRSMILK